METLWCVLDLDTVAFELRGGFLRALTCAGEVIGTAPDTGDTQRDVVAALDDALERGVLSRDTSTALGVLHRVALYNPWTASVSFHSTHLRTASCGEPLDLSARGTTAELTSSGELRCAQRVLCDLDRSPEALCESVMAHP